MPYKTLQVSKMWTKNMKRARIPNSNERLRKLEQAGYLGGERVYSTADHSTKKEQEEHDEKTKNLAGFDEAIKKQKDQSEHGKGPGGRVSKKIELAEA